MLFWKESFLHREIFFQFLNISWEYLVGILMNRMSVMAFFCLYGTIEDSKMILNVIGIKTNRQKTETQWFWNGISKGETGRENDCYVCRPLLWERRKRAESTQKYLLGWLCPFHWLSCRERISPGSDWFWMVDKKTSSRLCRSRMFAVLWRVAAASKPYSMATMSFRTPLDWTNYHLKIHFLSIHYSFVNISFGLFLFPSMVAITITRVW